MQFRYVVMPLLAFGSTSPALAQDAGSLLRDKEQGKEITLPPPPPTETAPEPSSTLSAQAERGPTLLVKSVAFTGKVALLDDAGRAELTRQIEGKEVDFAQIRAFTDSINATLRQNGHLLAHAIIPPQDATGGTLTIEIREGTLSEVMLEFGKGARIRKGILSGIIDSHIDKESLDSGDLESALLRINDLPGVSARSRLAPGSSPGTSRLMVDVEEEPVVTASFSGDNFGSPSTGRAQAHAQVAFSDVTGIGDLTRLGFSYSDGQRYTSASLAVPVSTTGLVASLNYAYLDYHNTDAVGSLAGLRGRAHYGSLGLSYQAARSRGFNLRFNAGLGGKALIDDSAAGRLQDKRIVSGTLGFTADLTDHALGGGITQFTAGWTYGDLDLSRVPGALLGDSLSLRTQGGFHRLNADLVRLQSLPGPLSLMVRASGQWSSKNLDSSESFSLGGPYGVRGWPTGEGRGDAGITGTLELRYDLPLPPKLGGLQFTAFFDAGKVWLNKDALGLPSLNACGCNSYSLSSAGLGVSWRQHNFSLSGTWARGLGTNPGRSVFGGTNVDGRTDRQQFWLSGSLSF